MNVKLRHLFVKEMNVKLGHLSNNIDIVFGRILLLLIGGGSNNNMDNYSDLDY